MGKMMFCNFGGNYQLKIKEAEDLRHVLKLPETRWVATSAPVSSFSCDPLFLKYLDADHNGRIRSDEVKAAITWLFGVLAKRNCVTSGSNVLRLDDIDTKHPEGSSLRVTAERILSNLNCPDAGQISLAQVRDLQSIMASAANNGDGVIPPEAAKDADTIEFISAVIECIGSVADASGKLGITEEHLKQFLDEVQGYLEWKSKGVIPKGEQKTDVIPCGTATPKAFQVFESLRGKIDQYFIQCDLVKLNKKFASHMYMREEKLETMNLVDSSAMETHLKGAPLAPPDDEGILYLEKVINPFYSKPLSELKVNVLNQLLGKPISQLTKQQWNSVVGAFSPYRDWIKNKVGARVEKLGEDRLRAYLDGPCRERVRELIVADTAVAKELQQIHNLEKCILYQRWLVEFVNNFVSFPNLYDPNKVALFEMGKLVIDGRELLFTLKVADQGEHKKIARISYMYLLYVEIIGKEDKTDKFEIVAAVTSGDASGLRVGKRGIFFTNDGCEWDAQVVEIVSHPISLWESIKAPFKMVQEFIAKQVEKLSKSQQAKLETSLSGSSPSGWTRDLLLGGGVALAVLGSALAYITKVLSQVQVGQVLLVLLGIVMIAVVPSIIIGIIRLRKRDLTAILEACGWAVNIRMRLTGSLGCLFTRTPRFPGGAVKVRKDMVKKFTRQFGYSLINWKRVLIITLFAAFIIFSFLFVVNKYPAIIPNCFKCFGK